MTQLSPTSNAKIMTDARTALCGHWRSAVGLAALMVLWSGIGAALDGLGSVLALLLEGPLSIGTSLYFLQRLRGGNPRLAVLQQGFRSWRVFGVALAAYLLISLLLLLGLLLLLVPAIIVGLAYAMTFYILAEAPEMSALAAMRQSRRMMCGNKWKLFCLMGRFTGWMLLGVLTLGVGFLWVLPYFWCSVARFYLDLCATPASGRHVVNPLFSGHP